MQDCVTLSVTEAELVAATTCAQDMLFSMRVLESMSLKVKKPMILEVDNKGAKDLTHNWSVGGRTRHVDVREYFLRDLKEEGTISVKWISTKDNSSDLFTKNLAGPEFEKHTSVYCGIDKYMQYKVESKSAEFSAEEGVGLINQDSELNSTTVKKDSEFRDPTGTSRNTPSDVDEHATWIEVKKQTKRMKRGTNKDRGVYHARSV
jgi:hypothetical protein